MKVKGNVKWIKVVTMFVLVLSMVVTNSFTVHATKKLQLNKKSLNLFLYSKYQLKIKNKKATTKVKWSSANNKIAKVSANGVVTAKKIGSTKITAKVSNKKFVCKVKVKQPNTSNKAARKKFKEYLSQSQIRWGSGSDKYSIYPNTSFGFICLDMGKNKVPVMILHNGSASHSQGYVVVYQYVNGKVKEVAREDGMEEIEPEAGVFSMWHTGGGCGEKRTWYYRIISSKSLGKNFAHTAILDDFYEYNRSLFGDDVYQINEKNVTKKQFNTYYKNLTKNSSKNKNVRKWLLENTESNREKYFK